MPTTTAPAAGRVPIDPALDAAVHAAFLRGGDVAARHLMAVRLGFEPTTSQVQIAVGRHAWLTGTDEGDQSYQRRMVRERKPMPKLVPPQVRGFGVELEYNRGSYAGYGDQRGAIVQTLNADGVEAYNVGGYDSSHAVSWKWKMTTDATVTGGELVSPVLWGESGLKQVRAAIQAIKAHGGAAGRSQGLHVHHDVRDYGTDDMVRLIRNLSHAERAVASYVPRYRYDGSGSYRANVIGPYGWDQYLRAAEAGSMTPGAPSGGRRGWNRYTSWNLNPVLTYGSVEWRLLGNTLNPVKVRTWVLLGTALMAYTKQGGTLTTQVDARELTGTLTDAGLFPADEAARFVRVCDDRLAGRRVA